MRSLKRMLAILLTVATIGVAAEDKSFYGISPYKDNYFVTGQSKDQVKSQISFKYHVINIDYMNLYLGYTQLLFWNAYDNNNSSPMYDINFNPELFWRQDISFIPFFKFIQLTPWEHKSNGQPSNDKDRTWNSYGASIANEFDLKHINITTTSKVFALYAVGDKTPDVGKYISYSEFRFDIAPVFLYNKIINPYFTVRLIGGIVNPYGAREYNLKLKPQTDLTNLSLYFQMWEGYGQNQIDYNIYDKAYRMGIILQ